MKVEWNKVTWYSKILALAIFVALPFVGFWYGTQYGETLALTNVSSLLPRWTAGPAGVSYYQRAANWPTDQCPDAGFSVAHPFVAVTIPATFEPQTNFADAKLTVGASGSNVAVAQCLKPDASGGSYTGVATTTIGGVPFSIFTSAGAGAGNFYETTSYRTLHAGKCYAVEYTIHSAQIMNYPAQYNLRPFQKNTLTDVLDRMVGTFRFL